MELNFAQNCPTTGTIVVPIAKEADIVLPESLSGAEGDVRRAARASDFAG